MATMATPASRPIFSIFTHSVGAHTAGHTLPAKLRAIARAGLKGVEIFQDDLDAYASGDEFAQIYKALTPPSSPRDEELGGRCVDDDNNDLAHTAWNAHGRCTPLVAHRELMCAHYIGAQCRMLGLAVLSLQPMRDVEGWVEPSKRHDAFQRVRSRFPILRALGTDLLLLCSNNAEAPATTGDVEVVARDIGQVADEAAAFTGSKHDMATTPAGASLAGPSSSRSDDARPLRIAFEALSWGAHIDVWSQAYAAVVRANRANLGLCLDSFNTLGREYADPCTASGIQEPVQETDKRLAASMHALAATVDPARIFFVQIADARRPLTGPLKPSPRPDEPRPSRMIWSRSNRLFPGEAARGTYLPVLAFVRAVLGAGYKGPWSIEVFNDSLNDTSASVPDEHAQRAYAGLDWLTTQLDA